MIFFPRVLLALAIGASAAGCADMETRVSTTGECLGRLSTPQKGADAVELLGYFQRIRSMTAEELGSEYALVSQAFAKQKSDAGRLRLAMLLSLPHASFRDDARAVQLAEEVQNAKPADGAPAKQFAGVLVSVVNEQRRQEERYQKLGQKLKDEEKRGEALQQKLEALKTIEKNLINREQAPPVQVK